MYRETYRRKPKWGLYIFQAFAFLQEHDFLIFKLSQSLSTRTHLLDKTGQYVMISLAELKTIHLNIFKQAMDTA